MAKLDANALIKHLTEKWAGRPCAQCGVANWQVQDAVFELRQFSGGGLVVGGTIIPVVPVTCANCGNTVLINAIRAGVVEQPAEAKKG
jgi:hypothetical protein